jgi:hypothetical protein
MGYCYHHHLRDDCGTTRLYKVSEEEVRDPARRKRLLEQIEKLWEAPHRQDMRLMQLLLNALASSHCRHTLYNVEDFELERALTNAYDNR